MLTLAIMKTTIEGSYMLNVSIPSLLNANTSEKSGIPISD